MAYLRSRMAYLRTTRQMKLKGFGDWLIERERNAKENHKYLVYGSPQ